MIVVASSTPNTTSRRWNSWCRACSVVAMGSPVVGRHVRSALFAAAQ